MDLNSILFNIESEATPVINNSIEPVHVADAGHFAADWNVQKTQDISLEQLAMTNREMMANKQPMHGIYHFQFIQSVMQMAAERGLQPEVTDLFAAKAGGTQYPGVSLNEEVAKRLGNPLDVRAYTLRRVYSTIRIKDTENNGMSTAIAVSYTQKGIQVGCGRYVHICHNQTILGAQQYFSTFSEHKGRGGDKFTFTDCLSRIAMWLDNIFQISNEDDALIRKMKNTPLTANMLLTVIGELTAIRVACDSNNKKIRLARTYPLNNTQINDLTENMLIKFKDNGNRMSVWDLYDTATTMYKAKSMDFTQLLPQNIAMVDYIKDTFKI